mmetsp:Transcript_18845/g.60028  ORF Transcript_18845/g.60028 Transcript_18845/m.60028 type:complete len:210 (+) Transcript_18845:305-934(+)
MPASSSQSLALRSPVRTTGTSSAPWAAAKARSSRKRDPYWYPRASSCSSLSGLRARCLACHSPQRTARGLGEGGRRGGRRCDEEADGRVSPPREEGEVASAVRRAGEGGAKVVPSRREQLEGGRAPGDGAPVDRVARPLPPRGGVPSLQQPLPPKLVVAVALGEGDDVGRPLAAADAVATHRSDQPLAPPLPTEVEGVVRLDGSSSLRR